MADISNLIGKTLVRINGAERGSERIDFVTSDLQRFVMYHSRDCCESVDVEDIAGDIADLIGSPILLAEEVVSDAWPMDRPSPEYEPESYTWTFYKLATIKGSVTVRWFGTSNGYYSERVYFEEAA